MCHIKNLPDVDRVISFHLGQADVSVCSSKGDCVMNRFLDRRLDQLSVVSCSQLAVQLTRSPQLKNVLPIEVHLEKKIVAHFATKGRRDPFHPWRPHLRHVSHESGCLRRNDLFLLDSSKVYLSITHVETLRARDNLCQDGVIVIDSQSDFGASAPEIRTIDF